MNTKSCFAPAHILLPSEQIPLEKWGCIACDQFTSDRDYWQKAEAAAAGSPSTLNMILPEVYLEDGDADARIEKIHATMDDYARNVLTLIIILIDMNLDLVLLQVILNLEDNKLFNVMLVHKMAKLMMVL